MRTADALRSSRRAPEPAHIALERDPTIDLVFTDVVMPGRMDGLALARAIREKHPGLPVLVTTGYSDALA